jgi:hypothetical protein
MAMRMLPIALLATSARHAWAGACTRPIELIGINGAVNQHRIPVATDAASGQTTFMTNRVDVRADGRLVGAQTQFGDVFAAHLCLDDSDSLEVTGVYAHCTAVAQGAGAGDSPAFSDDAELMDSEVGAAPSPSSCRSYDVERDHAFVNTSMARVDWGHGTVLIMSVLDRGISPVWKANAFAVMRPDPLQSAIAFADASRGVRGVYNLHLVSVSDEATMSLTPQGLAMSDHSAISVPPGQYTLYVSGAAEGWSTFLPARVLFVRQSLIPTSRSQSQFPQVSIAVRLLGSSISHAQCISCAGAGRAVRRDSHRQRRRRLRRSPEDHGCARRAALGDHVELGLRQDSLLCAQPCLPLDPGLEWHHPAPAISR